MFLHEKTRAAAAPRKPKKGAVSSPLNADDIFSDGEKKKISDQIRSEVFFFSFLFFSL